MQSRRNEEGKATVDERARAERNRNLLADLNREFNEFKVQAQANRQEIQQLKSQVQQLQVAPQELQQLKSQVQQLQSSQQDVQSVKNDMRSLMGTQKDIKSELHSVKGTQQEVQGMKTKMQAMEQKTPQLANKTELQKIQSEHQREMNDLKKGVQSSDALTRLQSKTDLVKMEFDELKSQIFARGLLAPKPEIPEDPEEPPPVGVVQLGEDVFTARLLIRLGFMKARKDEFLAECAAENGLGERSELTVGSAGYSTIDDLEDEYEVNDPRTLALACAYSKTLGDDDEDELAEFLDDSNVHGISDIEALVVAILITGAEDAGEGCLEKPLTPEKWWLLHVSKGMAIGVASVLMGRELMDVVNYAMVSCLVEPHINIEMVFCSTSRIVLAGLIGVANVLIFSYLKHPVSVWINMTALAFIGELGTGMLDVARRGVFGHHIMKTMTGLNFELTFVDQYPKWFKSVRFLALAIACVFGMICSVYAFLGVEQACPIEHHHNGTHHFGPHIFGDAIGENGEGGGGGAGAVPHHHR